MTLPAVPPTQPRLANLTTLRVGGPAQRLLAPGSRDELVATALDVWSGGEPWLVLGGGSNLLVADDGFDGTVLRAETRGIAEQPASDDGRVRLRVEAGEEWDAVVAHTVERGLAGMEALSGIPGATGAAPIQNIGAYGQEVSGTLVAVEFLDYLTGDLRRLPAAELGLGYRTSVFKRGREGVVTAVEFALERTGAGPDAPSGPVRYAQLAAALGVEMGERSTLGAVREAVLRLRRSKGMVIDPADPDSVSAGSFFTNPLVSEHFARTLPEDAPRFPVDPAPADLVMPLGEPVPAFRPPVPGMRVKLSAAWLIERSGIRRGFALPGSRAAISRKHTLALTNRGGASAEEVAELARYVRTVVLSETGVLLQPEPVLVGLTL